MSTKRYEGLDILKAVCAFLIVCIHAPFPGAAGGYITALARVGVPIFFMITGYFYDRTVADGKELHQIRKIFLLLLSANVLFFIYQIGISLIERTIPGYFHNTFTLANILKFLFLNESIFGGHLWYLGAVLYVLVIFFFLRKWLSKRDRPHTHIYINAYLTHGGSDTR